MKKLNFLAVAAMLFAAMTLTGCDPTETPDDGDGTGTEIPDDKDGDGDGGGNNGDIRLVDKVTFDDGYGYRYGFQLFYDSQNRVSKMEIDLERENIEGEYMTATYSYGANTLTINFSQNIYDDFGDGELHWVKATDNSVYNLDPEGHIVSQASHSWKSYKDGVLDDESDEPTDIVLSYENGYLKTFTNPDASSGGGSYGDFTMSSVTEYFVEDGNLIKIVETSTNKYVDGTHEDEVSTYETTYTYSDKINLTNVGYNPNAMMFGFGDDRIDVLNDGEFFGKSSKNLVSSKTTNSSVTKLGVSHTYVYKDEYDWELDSEGYVTKMTVTDEKNRTRTVTVTYKN